MVRLQQNLPLKLISLTASILLFFYVQAERNPMLTRLLTIPVVRLNAPPDADVEADLQQLKVAATGPRALIEHIKEGDIRAIADLRNVAPGSRKAVSLRYDYPGLNAEQQAQVTLDSDPLATPLHVQIYPQKTRLLITQVLFPRTPRPGFTYSAPEVKPAQIKVIGRAQRVDHVARLVIAADPTSPGGEINGDFPITPRDRDNNIVENVLLMPDTVHVNIHLEEEPYPKIVTVSANILDQPPPGYRFLGDGVVPNQVRISGRPEDVQSISTVSTEAISIHEFTHSQTIEANLIVPPKVSVTDLNGHSRTKVTLRLQIEAIPQPPVEPPPHTSGATTTTPILPPGATKP